MTEPSPQAPARAERPRVDVRVGSSTNALSPVSVAERSLAATAHQWLALSLVAVAAIAADQGTKALVSGQLAVGEETATIGPFSIHHVHNSGIAFGFFSDATAIVIVLTAAAVAWMLAFFTRSGGRHPVLPVGLGLVSGGSVSNLVDRIRLGYVTDFLDFRYWPAFNLADTFIVAGVGVLVAVLVLPDRAAGRVRRASNAHDPRL